MPADPYWSLEDMATLRRLFAEGCGPNAIARIMGKTRNSVVGKCFRLGLKTGHRIAAQRRERMKQVSIKPKPLRKHNHNPWGLGIVEKAMPLQRPESIKDGKGLPLLNVVPTKSISELGRNHCRAIGERPELLTLDTKIYCGARTDGGSWCPEHRAQVFKPRNSGGG